MQKEHSEASLQRACVIWFVIQYPQYAGLLIHVPNGGSRISKAEGARLRRQGVVAGVSDLLLLLPRHNYGCLCIEMKTDKGKQSEKQKAWETKATNGGNMYVVCRSIDGFINTINSYLNY